MNYRDFSNISNTGEGTDFTKPPYTYDDSYQSATGSLTMVHSNIDRYYGSKNWAASVDGEIRISGVLTVDDEVKINGCLWNCKIIFRKNNRCYRRY